MRTIAFAAVLSLGLVTQPSLAWKASKVASFELAGVKLGMTQQEALEALAKNFQVDAATIKVVPYTSRGYENNPYDEESIDITNGLIKVRVVVTPVPSKSNKDTSQAKRVSAVIYATLVPNNDKAALDAASATLEKSLLARYGKPSYQSKASGLTWCSVAKSKAVPSCDTDYMAQMLLHRNQAVLIDGGYRAELDKGK